MVRLICTKFGDSNPNTSRLVHVKLCAMWCRFVLVRAKRLGGSLFGGHTVYALYKLTDVSGSTVQILYVTNFFLSFFPIIFN